MNFYRDLDQDLRNEINMMEISGISPSECGPKIMNTPSVRLITITNAKKMQSAESVEYDFSGANSQTQVFATNKDTLKNNYNKTLAFIQSLGAPDENEDHFISNNLVWRDIDNDKVEDYIKQYQFSKRQYVFDHINELFDWVSKTISDKILKNWNVVLHNTKSNKQRNFPIENLDSFKITRTREKEP